jgi:hypothetical protein
MMTSSLSFALHDDSVKYPQEENVMVNNSSMNVHHHLAVRVINSWMLFVMHPPYWHHHHYDHDHHYWQMNYPN